jgi:hypothetical protein
MAAANVLEHIHSDLCVAECLRFLAAERGPDMRLSLGHALLSHFAEEAVEPICRLVGGEDESLTPDECDLRYRLVAASTIMGTRCPNYEQWYQDALQSNWGWYDLERGRIRENFCDDEDEAFEEEDDLDEDQWEEEFDEDGYFGEERTEPRLFGDFEEARRGPQPIKNLSKPPGRNDPCPCGSGKKYKKCCLKKG